MHVYDWRKRKQIPSMCITSSYASFTKCVQSRAELRIVQSGLEKTMLKSDHPEEEVMDKRFEPSAHRVDSGRNNG